MRTIAPMGRTRTLLAGLCATALLVALTACGTSDQPDVDPDIARSYDVSAIHKDEALAAMLPQSITKDGKLTIGSNLTYAPAEFLATDGRTPVGYEIDFAKALANLFGLELDVQNAPFESIIPAVGTKYDIGLSGFTVNNERIEAVDFVTYAKAGLTFAVRKGNPAHASVNDLCGERISVQVGTVGETEMYKAQDKCSAEGKKAIELLPYGGQNYVTTALVSGRVNMMYGDTPVIGYAVAQTDDQLEIIGEDEGVAPMGMAIAKGDEATVQAMKAALDKLIADGTYTKIMDAWGVQNVMIKEPEINPRTDE